MDPESPSQELRRRLHAFFPDITALMRAVIEDNDTYESLRDRPAEFVQFLHAVWNDPATIDSDHALWLLAVVDLLPPDDEPGDPTRRAAATPAPPDSPASPARAQRRPSPLRRLMNEVDAQPEAVVQYAVPVIQFLVRVRDLSPVLEVVLEDPQEFLEAVRDEADGLGRGDSRAPGSEAVREMLRGAAVLGGFASLDEVVFAAHDHPRHEPAAVPPASPQPGDASYSEPPAGTVEERFLPNVRAWLAAGGSEEPRPHVACLMCTAELVVEGLQDAGDDREEAFTLNCGHMFGRTCLRAWLASLRAQADLGGPAQRPRCPDCRVQISVRAVAELIRN